MTYSTDDYVRSTTRQAASLQRKFSQAPVSSEVRTGLSARFSGNVNNVRKVTNLHRSVMLILEETKPNTDLNMRLAAFAAGVSVAIELAELIKTKSGAYEKDDAAGKADIATLDDLSELANAALDTGKQPQGFQVLEGIGYLLGGAPRAALERALGFMRIKQKRKACDELEKAVEGMVNDDGLVSALLVQLWFDIKDPRWIQLAKRVMATGLSVDARTRCGELLASINAR